MAPRRTPADVDDYLSWFDGDVRKRLEKVRQTIRKAAPGSTEKISYAIPTIVVDGKYLLYFAAFDKHLSVYPAPRGAPGLADELAQYAGGKGTVQFPHDQPIPYDLIRRMALHHLERIRAKRPGPKKGATKPAAKKPAARKTAAKKTGAKKTAARKGAK